MTLSIALCGLGAAGRARLRALETLPGFKLAGIVSRRPEHASLSWEQALSDPSIAAIAISTENTRHALLVREALEAGKHVLCDYPLAFTASEISSLLELAQKKNRVLHVEHIGLLSSSHADVVNQLPTLGTLRSGAYHFEGGWSEKLADLQVSGPLPFLAYSRLLQIFEWFGPLQILEKKFEANLRSYHLHLKLELASGGLLDFYEDRSQNLHRRRWMKAEFEKGRLDWNPSSVSENLFAKDLGHFRDRISGEATPYYSEAFMLAVTPLLERLA